MKQSILISKKNIIASLILAILLTSIYFWSIFYNLHSNPFIINLFFCIFQIGFLFLSYKNFKLKTDLEYLELQKSTLQQQHQTYELTESKIQQNITNIQKILQNIDNELSTNHTMDATTFLNYMEDSFEPLIYTHYCRNRIIDIILHNKELECQHKNIHFSYNILIPDNLYISDSKLISLFFNLLNNGIESCENSKQAEPFLSLSIDYRGDFLFVSMINSKSIATEFNYKTTKNDSFYHGLGLSIIENIVHELDGFCEWKDLKESFQSTLMFRYQKTDTAKEAAHV